MAKCLLGPDDTEVLGVLKEDIPRGVLGMKYGLESAQERGDERVCTALHVLLEREPNPSRKRRMGWGEAICL